MDHIPGRPSVSSADAAPMEGVSPDSPTPPPDEIETVMRAARLFSGVVAASVARAGGRVTSPQLRVLVLVATRPGLNASGVAGLLGIHLSSASRLVDRLVRVGLLSRRESEVDRRNVDLGLTEQGEGLLDEIMEHRRSIVSEILGRMAPSDRRLLGRVLTSLCDAAGEPLAAPW